MLSLNPLHYVILALVLGTATLTYKNYALGGEINTLKKEHTEKINELEAENTKLNTKMIANVLNHKSISNALYVANEKVKQNKIDIDKKHKEFIEATKPKEVIKYITKYITEVSDDKTECENINNILDSIDTYGM